MIDIDELRRDASAAHAGHMPMELSGSEIIALLDRLEAAEKDVILKEQVIDALGLELNDVAKEHDALRAALQHETDCLEAANAKIKALRAKITEMEKQEPVVYQRLYRDGSGTEDITDLPDVFEHQRPLYALPGAKGE